MKKYVYWLLILLIFLGLADSIYLTYEHYALGIACPVSPWINCLAVTSSKYSEIFGIPLALFGVIYYFLMFLFLKTKTKMTKQFFLVTSGFGAFFSIYLIYIQAFLIKLFCYYCLGSALISFLIFGISSWCLKKEKEGIWIDLIGYCYKFLVKPILFLINPEAVHESFVDFGQFVSKIFSKLPIKKYPKLKQKIANINFNTPIGLAAGFDYDAKLTQTLPSLGFGFGTVGTVTNMSYQGNPSPRLGRLPKSKSLMVNKGFKSAGAVKISNKLSKLKFSYPVGVSIGRTNSKKLNTVDKSIKDIVSAFKTFENKKIKNSYYELNISCPNLIHDVGINFYETKNLKKLLTAIDKLKIKKSILVKMPIDQSDRQTLKMLKVISKHKIAGVIFGNLQTNKKDKSFDKDELKKFKVGKFSGKPTFKRSNGLIKLSYKKYKDRFVIVGCGGVFNAEDAWKKFENGASLVQLITGMIFEGPQLIAQINRDLDQMLVKKNYKSIAEVIGSNVD